MTGYRGRFVIKQSRWLREKKDSVLFGFDIIRGFPVDYTFWCLFLYSAMRMPTASPSDMNVDAAAGLDAVLVDLKEEHGQNYDTIKYPLWAAWERFRPDFDAFLRSYAFVERDQAVVPSLNLKSAKKVICHDERQKKALRRMGFIEDRIQIRNTLR
jgi:hypothetical protein